MIILFENILKLNNRIIMMKIDFKINLNVFKVN